MMADQPAVSTPASTPASAVRSILSRAASARVTWLGAEAEAYDVSAVVIRAPKSHLPAGVRACIVEIADTAPVPAADRIRARVRLHGYAAPGGCPCSPPLQIGVTAVDLERDGRTHTLTPEELRAAQPDPFAHTEAHLLGHLAEQHPDVVERLAGLAVDDPTRVRVSPWALDRHGITLRVCGAEQVRNVHLAFPRPAESTADLQAGMQALTIQAASRRRGRRGASTRRVLADLFRSGAAADRICRPD
ncbi:DUF2470 domain-containing protein [Nocardioides limicola]|uniref:DUF2470 domain-containing protein n=1 Tax=Nocardioides limicola TaxID=2803368 RepID=UPI00193B3D02|nr:DUF2470 domain-containing protein [Nocardioides sp. DJM-14]